MIAAVPASRKRGTTVNEQHEPGADVRAAHEIAFAHGVSVPEGADGRIRERITSRTESVGVDDAPGYLVDFDGLDEPVFATDDDLESR
jgi:hypothetical protein